MVPLSASIWPGRLFTGFGRCCPSPSLILHAPWACLSTLWNPPYSAQYNCGHSYDLDIAALREITQGRLYFAKPIVATKAWSKATRRCRPRRNSGRSRQETAGTSGPGYAYLAQRARQIVGCGAADEDVGLDTFCKLACSSYVFLCFEFTS